ncbi:MAG: TetR/AcrR family transcriptional regulator [Acidimicrobiaceae bacterium]|nr:TetR/AcrR family transcriptional regulator [Acidimicrobiaceae bacterium]
MSIEISGRPYHHGRLREALIEAAMAASRSDGPEAVALRAVSRHVGVTPNAAYRHFADRDDLLRAVARRCLDLMGELMEARLAAAEPLSGPDGAWMRLQIAGRAYVEFAVSEPGWFKTAFSIPIDPDPYRPGGARGLFHILVSVLDQLAETGAIAPSQRIRAEYVAWSAVHGIATLLTGGSLQGLPPGERTAAVDRVILAVRF